MTLLPAQSNGVQLVVHEKQLGRASMPRNSTSKCRHLEPCTAAFRGPKVVADRVAKDLAEMCRERPVAG